MGLIDGEHKITEIPNEWSRSCAAWVFRYVKTKHASQQNIAHRREWRHFFLGF
jgi:hypothetical protein